jgi:hypothetical protein
MTAMAVTNYDVGVEMYIWGFMSRRIEHRAFGNTSRTRDLNVYIT